MVVPLQLHSRSSSGIIQVFRTWSVVGIRGYDLTEEIVVNEVEFEELALDVIVEEVSWYLKWDVEWRILLMSVVTGRDYGCKRKSI
ncbi:uncharacterized protein [Henckelia pumila]|uniref:uncharacterized protein isoform X2 n=1 Tax=Henckelia pumila TaxID=405737 RepID=UPI003C6E8DEE